MFQVLRQATDCWAMYARLLGQRLQSCQGFYVEVCDDGSILHKLACNNTLGSCIGGWFKTASKSGSDSRPCLRRVDLGLMVWPVLLGQLLKGSKRIQGGCQSCDNGPSFYNTVRARVPFSEVAASKHSWRVTHTHPHYSDTPSQQQQQQQQQS